LPARPCAHLDALVGRDAVTLSATRPVLPFDLVGFTTLPPTTQLVRLAALEATAGIGRYWHLHRIEHGQPRADG
jgi:hypothetical protein